MNLNAAESPSWARLRRSGAEPPLLGPLFQASSDVFSPESTDFAPLDDDGLLAALEPYGTRQRSCARGLWHLGEHDFQEKRDCLKEALRSARQRRHMSFVLDRKGSPVALAEGRWTAGHDAVLQVVGLHLNRLADMNGIDGNPENLLAKLLHLAQMAHVSAGVQKRRFLKQTTEGCAGQSGRGLAAWFLSRSGPAQRGAGGACNRGTALYGPDGDGQGRTGTGKADRRTAWKMSVAGGTSRQSGCHPRKPVVAPAAAGRRAVFRTALSCGTNQCGLCRLRLGPAPRTPASCID